MILLFSEDWGGFFIRCFVGLGLLGGIPFGLSYLAGRLAEMHGNMWEERLKKENPEVESSKETNA